MAESTIKKIPLIQLEKPAFGSPCNGCGQCCIDEVCQFGKDLGDSENCLALVAFDDGSYGCNLMIDPYQHLSEKQLATWQRVDQLAGHPVGRQALIDNFKKHLGSGQGCDSSI